MFTRDRLRHRLLNLLFIAPLLAVTPRAADAASDMTCPADPVMAALQLPHLREAINAQLEGLIVAIGSSSTQGVMASDSAHTYPAILQADLNQAIPTAHFAVINRGIGGQDAPEELARLDTDAIALRPQLIVWQVGANAALRNANPTIFHRMVLEGVKRIIGAGIDVILMDNQRSPRVLASGDHLILEQELQTVANETRVNLFSRGHLMDAWADEGAKPELFTASDGMHHNDRGYACVTHVLARLVVTALTAPSGLSASLSTNR